MTTPNHHIRNVTPGGQTQNNQYANIRLRQIFDAARHQRDLDNLRRNLNLAHAVAGQPAPPGGFHGLRTPGQGGIGNAIPGPMPPAPGGVGNGGYFTARHATRPVLGLALNPLPQNYSVDPTWAAHPADIVTGPGTGYPGPERIFGIIPIAPHNLTDAMMAATAVINAQDLVQACLPFRDLLTNDFIGVQMQRYQDAVIVNTLAVIIIIAFQPLGVSAEWRNSCLDAMYENSKVNPLEEQIFKNRWHNLTIYLFEYILPAHWKNVYYRDVIRRTYKTAVKFMTQKTKMEKAMWSYRYAERNTIDAASQDTFSGHNYNCLLLWDRLIPGIQEALAKHCRVDRHYVTVDEAQIGFSGNTDLRNYDATYRGQVGRF